MANLIRGLSENGGIVFCGVDSTDIVRKAEQLHTTSATCSAALGRLLTGASLMGAMLKDERDQVTLRIQGGGPAGVLIACTDGTGNVKGCIDNPLVELPPKANGHLDVGGAVGKNGVLTVIRDNRLQKEPTVGQVPLVSGEIAEDLTSYYATSEQVPTVCALGVLVDKDLSILCAGGYLLQLLPGATDAEIDQLEQNIAAMPSVTEMLHAGKTPRDMMELAMAGFAPEVLDERTVQYQCGCSAERTREMLLSLGRRELVKMRDEDPQCEVVCHFCHTKYHFDLNDLIAEYDAQAPCGRPVPHREKLPAEPAGWPAAPVPVPAPRCGKRSRTAARRRWSLPLHRAGEARTALPAGAGSCSGRSRAAPGQAGTVLFRQGAAPTRCRCARCPGGGVLPAGHPVCYPR